MLAKDQRRVLVNAGHPFAIQHIHEGILVRSLCAIVGAHTAALKTEVHEHALFRQDFMIR